MATPIPSTLVDDADSFYVSERKIHARDVDGRYARLRRAALVWLLGMYYAFAWLPWDDRQAVLFDLPARRFYVFGLTFWPQDFVFLALLLIILALCLFFFTALAGRLFCGYACPQTVWTELFMWIESRIEGDRAQRIKLDAAPWSANKLLRRGAKHVAWISLALWTGFTFVGYFTPISDLAARLPALDWNGWETFWVLFYGFATWGNAGFLREQVCKYMCPYARFQSAMFDRNTLIIAYDPMRGEPRGARKRGLPSVLERARGLLDTVTAYDYVFRANRHPSAADARAQARGTIVLAGADTAAEPLPKFAPEQLGDCIDCTLCVQVCPTGIDIRNGLQYECIACGACIDACDDVMGKLGYPSGLIRYSTQNAIDGRPTRIVRPRLIVYAALLIALVGGWALGVAMRSPLHVDVLRDRNALYRLTETGSSNGYLLKIANKTDHVQRYAVEIVEGPARPRAAIAVDVPAEQLVPLPVELYAPGDVRGRHDVTFAVIAPDGTRVQVETTYFGPDR